MRFSRGTLPGLSICPALTAGILLIASCLPAAAQGIRGEFRVGASAIDFRTVERDSFPESEVPGDGITRRLPDGSLVTCVPGGYCYRYRSGTLQTASPMTQDLNLTAWPGWRGVQARTHLRGRFGSDDLWPRSDQELAVLDLSVDFDRDDFRLRAGRQDHHGGLGAIHFDGGSILWKGPSTLRLTAFGGRSLGRGLDAPYSGSLLAEADNIANELGAVLIGFEGRVRPTSTLSTSLLYQREIRTDRASLYSERMALDAGWQAGRSRAEFSGDLDVASLVINDLRLLLGRSITPGLDLAIEARHSSPFFELWTIWGAFTPVGFDQLRLSGSYRASAVLTFDATAAYRDYRDTETGIGLAPIEGDAFRSHLGGGFHQGGWSASATAGVDHGFGAYRGQFDLALDRSFGPRTAFGLHALGTEQFTEFRFGEGTTHGVGFVGRHGAGAVDVTAQLARFRHTFHNRPGYEDYDQWRGTLALKVRFGSDPIALTNQAGGATRS
ncbi:MAG: hypothetical protein SGI90_05825 [Candidatus Eisenbacteria bacterium]|nr:hypothetical protein [Candidatus Eisenbacteria bacterium]